jgi:hypothetical protein
VAGLDGLAGISVNPCASRSASFIRVGGSVVDGVDSGERWVTVLGAASFSFAAAGAVTTGGRRIGLGLGDLSMGFSDFSSACDIFPTRASFADGFDVAVKSGLSTRGHGNPLAMKNGSTPPIENE